jgi:hypothetical protein
MKYILLATMTAMAVFTGPAYAQFSGNSGAKTPLQLQYEQEEQAQKDNERQYNATMKRLRAQEPTNSKSDPWRNVRPAGQPDGRR